MPLQLICVLLMSLFLVLFTFQNPHPVELNFVAWGSKQFPLVAVVLVSALLGVILSTIMSLKNSLSLNRKINDLQNEVDDLKTPPPVPIPAQEEALK